MTLSSSLFRLTIVLALSAAPFAYAQETTQEAEQAAEAEPPAADPLEGLTADTPLAMVNGEPLSLGELIALRNALPEQYQGLAPEVLMEGLGEQLINQFILAQLAREAGLADHPGIKLALQNLVNSSLADTYMRQELDKRVTVEALTAAYEAQYVNAEPVPEIRASHILVKEEDAAKALAKQLDEGADFAELAAEHGTDGTKARGGDLGWFVYGDMIPEFSEAAFGIAEVDAVAGPVQSPFGWHMIKLTGKRDRPAPPLVEVQEELLKQVTETAQREIIAESRAAANVERLDGDVPATAIMADHLLEPAE